MNVNPKSRYGPIMWYIVHTFAGRVRTSSDKYNYQQFLFLLRDLMPCAMCKKHFIENLANEPMTLETPESAVMYTYRLHSLVNKQKGIRDPPWEQVRRYYYVENEQRELVTGSSCVPPDTSGSIMASFFIDTLFTLASANPAPKTLESFVIKSITFMLEPNKRRFVHAIQTLPEISSMGAFDWVYGIYSAVVPQHKPKSLICDKYNTMESCKV